MTGQPISFNNIPNDFGDLRPNRVGNPNTGSDPAVDRQFLYVNGFALQPVDTPGDSGRNVAHGPRFGSLDLTLVKRFTLTERTRLDIRGEAFNLFNHVNFKDPNQTTWGDDGFGIINDAFDRRVVQLAARFQF